MSRTDNIVPLKGDDLDNMEKIKNTIELAYNHYLWMLKGYDPAKVDDVLMEQIIAWDTEDFIDEEESIHNSNGLDSFNDRALKAYSIIVDALRERVFSKN